MIENLPFYTMLAFCLTTFATLVLFTLAIKNSTNEVTKRKATAIFFGLEI